MLDLDMHMSAANGAFGRRDRHESGGIEDSSACFIVRDRNKQALALAYAYFGNKPGRRSSGEPLTWDEAFLIAVSPAKLPTCRGRY